MHKLNHCKLIFTYPELAWLFQIHSLKSLNPFFCILCKTFCFWHNCTLGGVTFYNHPIICFSSFREKKNTHAIKCCGKQIYIKPNEMYILFEILLKFIPMKSTQLNNKLTFTTETVSKCCLSYDGSLHICMLCTQASMYLNVYRQISIHHCRFPNQS